MNKVLNDLDPHLEIRTGIQNLPFGFAPRPFWTSKGASPRLGSPASRPFCELFPQPETHRPSTSSVWFHTLYSRPESIPLTLRRNRAKVCHSWDPSWKPYICSGGHWNLVGERGRPILPTMLRLELKPPGWEPACPLLLNLSLFMVKWELVPPHRFVRGSNMMTCVKCPINVKFLPFDFRVLSPYQECPTSICQNSIHQGLAQRNISGPSLNF